MSVSNLTNGCKKAILELTELEAYDLQLACKGRLKVILDLLNVTRDSESRDNLVQRLDRVQSLHDRLEQLL